MLPIQDDAIAWCISLDFFECTAFRMCFISFDSIIYAVLQSLFTPSALISFKFRMHVSETIVPSRFQIKIVACEGKSAKPTSSNNTAANNSDRGKTNVTIDDTDQREPYASGDEME